MRLNLVRVGGTLGVGQGSMPQFSRIKTVVLWLTLKNLGVFKRRPPKYLYLSPPLHPNVVYKKILSISRKNDLIFSSIWTAEKYPSISRENMASRQITSRNTKILSSFREKNGRIFLEIRNAKTPPDPDQMLNNQKWLGNDHFWDVSIVEITAQISLKEFL